MDNLIAYIPLITIGSWALWKENPVAMMALFGSAVMSGLFTPDIIAGVVPSVELGLSLGLMIIMMGFLAAGWSFRLMFWSNE